METTPSSTRRITRSQTRAASTNNANLILSRKIEEPEKSTTKSGQMSAKKQQKDRTVLVDITNGSPIVGVAMENLETPSSAVSRVVNGRARYLSTPGSGESLLRGQVKTLLQKVEEDSELPKITLEARPFFNIQGVVNSPINLLAPTPANTPQILNFSDIVNGVTEKILIPEITCDPKNQETTESENGNGITRSLLLDFSDKSDSSDCSSALTYQGATLSGDTREKNHSDDDNSSIWSIQANASSSTRGDDYEEEEEEEEEEGECEEEYYEGEEYEVEEDYYGSNGDDSLLLDELCEGLSKVAVEGGDTVKFTGKRIRFVYNSDDELQGEEEVCPEEN